MELTGSLCHARVAARPQRPLAAAAARPQRLRVQACHRCLQQQHPRPLIPRLQQHSARGPGSAAAVKGDSAASRARPSPQQAAQPPAAAEQQEQQQDGEQQESMGVRAALAMLRFYKGAISPLLPPACRFQPTCSVYSMEAFQKFGVGRGFVLTAWRLLRCAPWGDRGYDPVRWPPPHLERLFGQQAQP